MKETSDIQPMGESKLTPDNTVAFEQIVPLIDHARENMFRSVNRELIFMYWNIGAHISGKCKNSGWGKSNVAEFAYFMQSRYGGIKGFSPQNIWQMKQFFETYASNERLSSLVGEISWTNNLLIMSRVKNDDAREFYILLCAKNNYSKHELERLIDSSLFERAVITTDTRDQLSIPRNTEYAILRDSYVLEFLGVPVFCKEKELLENKLRKLAETERLENDEENEEND